MTALRRFTTLVDSLDQAAATRPNRVAFTFLGDGVNVADSLTYAELLTQVTSVAAALAARCPRGARVGLVFGSDLGFVPAYLGTVLSGRVAVPLVAPQSAAARDVFDRILADAGPALVLTDGCVELKLAAGVQLMAAADAWRHTADSPMDVLSVRPDDIAMLQYTSGSTRQPRGVMVTHGNLMANQAQIHAGLGQDDDAVVVSWLPPYHDMGLIGGILHPIYLGAACVMMPPSAFLHAPLKWLAAISEHRGTISPAPNFAFDLCCEAAAHEEISGLALDSWAVACNGSEPVRIRTLRRFTDTFGPVGFSQTAFAPAYGLAEATLFVSTGQSPTGPTVLGERGRGGMRSDVVSCGTPSSDVIIVRDGRPARDGEEGEVWVRGASIARGYWRQAQETARTFEARLADGAGDPYLRTGDLGTMVDGQLFVTGRLDDVLVIRGRNHHPQDIEATAQGVDPRLTSAPGAAFMVDDRIVLVQAARDRTDVGDLPDRVRHAVARDHGIRVDEVVLVRSSSIPRTTSGKVRHAECRRRLLAGELAVVASSVSAETKEARAVTRDALGEVPSLVAGILRVDTDRLATDVPLGDLGIDSLQAMRLQGLLAQRLGIEVELEQLLGSATIADLAARPPCAAPAISTPRRAGATTAGQRALWALSQGAEGHAYTIVRAIRLPERTDLRALEHALGDLVAFHAQLRSQFAMLDGHLVRTERGAAEPRWFEVRDVPSEEASVTAVRAAAGQPLDLAADPLFSVLVLRTPDAGAVAFVRASHLVVDFRSLAVLAKELFVAYRGHVLGVATSIEPAPDFDAAVAQEERYLAGDTGRADLDAVATHLRDASPVRWPVVSPTGLGGGTSAGVSHIALSSDVCDLLARRASEAHVTIATAMLTLVRSFVQRVAGGDDFVVGVPMSIESAGMRDTVGYLVNTVALRLPGLDGESFPAALQATKEALVRALRWRRVPISAIAERLREQGDSPRGALYSILFNFLESDDPGIEGAGLVALGVPGVALRVGHAKLAHVEVPEVPPLADVDIAFTREGGQIVGRFAWDRRVLSDDDGELLAGLLADFIEAIARGLSSSDGWRAVPRRRRRRQLGSLPPSQTFNELFAASVRDRPGAPAIEAAGDAWSYAELSQWVDGIAAMLPAPGDAARPVLAILGDRDPAFAATALAAWRTGYALLPVSPSMPNERARFMVQDSGVDVVVQLSGDVRDAALVLDGLSREGEGVTVLSRDALPRPAATPPPADSSGGFVIYTSGTTGRPKAVSISQANVMPLLRWQVEGLGAGPEMRLAQTLTFAFDFGLQEILTTLLFGGVLCFPVAEERYGPRAFERFLDRHCVNTLFATPTLVNELVAEEVELARVTLLVIGGELLSAELVRSVRPRLAPGCRIINGYGPTEASINVAMESVGHDEALDPVPVGAATGASEIYVLDEHGRSVPDGLIGEIVIGGPGVADGYADRPDETAARFGADPWGGDGERIYRTGDRARILPDGRLQVLGRLDDQLKLRGHRVEPREVESVIRVISGVRDAAVLVRGRDGASPGLVAFIVGDACDPKDVRAEISRSLPLYMIPAQIVVVDRLPRGESGKLDAVALLARVPETTPVAAIAGPGSARVVQAIWQEVLGSPIDDIDANFFELGGQSLAVGAIVSRVCAECGVTAVTHQSVFEHPTLRSFAAYVDSLRDDAPRRHARPPLGQQRRNRRQPL